MEGPNMSTSSNQAILSFLDGDRVPGPKRLKAATLFAESMVRELKVSLREWEATADALRVFKRQTITALN
jgi:hypothetical protein